ncbi:MAG TPA: sensor domain-containing diguanylate cyclase [Vicinamibacterales bacterium]|jgi:diguanylate cyclase (GGDEF)-like protein/PAS domain S-box-containing protein|nr:sensor domain-containing diguanylate cyclase [Vicinamibacterales bacterium]
MTDNSDPIPLDTFRVLVEESLTGVYLIQQDRLVYANRRLAEIFGYTREEFLRLPSVLDLIADSHRDLVREKLRQRMAGELTAVEYTVRGIRKDRQLIDLDVRSVRTVHNGAPAVIGSMLDISDRTQLERSLRELSLTDELTGLYNRRGFSILAERQLALALRNSQPLLLIFTDVDGLKAINDTYGHAAGDQALRDTAAVLRATYRSADIIARIGGDEFTVFPVNAIESSGGILTERLDDVLARHAKQSDRPFKLSLTAGLACVDPAQCPTIESMLAEADRQLYERRAERGRK